MQKLIAELMRLYLPADAPPADVLTLHVLGQQNVPISLTGGDDQTRAMMIPFRKAKGLEGDAHWLRLCEVANTLQETLGLPAPAVSISGGDAYYLWLSLAEPVPADQAQTFLERLRDAYFPEIELDTDAVRAPIALPPCLHPRTGKWAAFIHPGMGASFADEPGLDMAPPPLGQAAFLEGLESIGKEQFEQVFQSLDGAQHGKPVAPQTPAAASAPSVSRDAAAPGLLLKDATLEDIVRHLHAMNIEPTFRHLLPSDRYD
ncbi:hypothetical protein [Massilia oculi]|jgi:hypothetical protein|uniref:hypothetical protein n=1 Tax=Massilia oculi TaxID=945844 RepID=UPI001AAE8A0D|nr:hypothetical protein [Massilia oculi]